MRHAANITNITHPASQPITYNEVSKGNKSLKVGEKCYRLSSPQSESIVKRKYVTYVTEFRGCDK
jgi:hypothetical protein